MTYNMKKLKITPTELMHKFKSAEQSLLKLGNPYHDESSIFGTSVCYGKLIP